MLDAISPIDGRYRKYTEPLAKFFSEGAFMRYRIFMECEYLIALKKVGGAEAKEIRKLAEKFSEKDAEEVKKIETTTNHDFKAIEYWMRDKLPEKFGNWIHFGLTSEDATNIAYGLMTTGALHEVLNPAIEKITNEMRAMAKTYKKMPMLARTHGQPASPTTFGKEIAVSAARLERQLKQIKSWRAPGKLAGATGNYNALVAAYPKINWPKFAKKFVESLGLKHWPLTTQIEPHDGLIELFDMLRRINMILIDFDQDIWRYISDGWIVQKPVESEIGSSTMPHKINPIKFENSEGNLGLASAIFGHFAAKLPVSRLQRDLSDSTVMRSIGMAFGYCLVGYTSLIDGLGRIDVNEAAMRQALAAHPEVITEAIQTILRREGVSGAYEKLKDLARGKELTMEAIADFIETLDIDEHVKHELRALRPETYIGFAEKLSRL